jgi:ribosomal peptide maturation radical SAM protein 1
LADAGVEMIQPGIESMHAHMLTLMRKGVTPLQNVQLLKWCAEMGVRPYWNLLYGFPGESARDYEEMLPLLQSLTHLQPPDGYGTIRLDRFSPYFRDPVSFGMANARPMKTYRYIYPFPEKDLADIAYFYEYTFANGIDPDSYIGPTLQLIGTWKEAANKRSSLIARKLSTGLLEITDTRPTAKQRLTLLHGWQIDLYDFCDQVRSITTIDRWLRENAPEVLVSEAHEFLDQLVQLRLMARDGDRYLSLAVAVRADDRWSSFPYQVAPGSGTTAVATA